jgi:hypothetical protein
MAKLKFLIVLKLLCLAFGVTAAAAQSVHLRCSGASEAGKKWTQIYILNSQGIRHTTGHDPCTSGDAILGRDAKSERKCSITATTIFIERKNYWPSWTPIYACRPARDKDRLKTFEWEEISIDRKTGKFYRSIKTIISRQEDLGKDCKVHKSEFQRGECKVVDAPKTKF